MTWAPVGKVRGQMQRQWRGEGGVAWDGKGENIVKEREGGFFMGESIVIW